ncbi:MAG: hypothetical protein ABMA14_15150 [Hyphomonadaceae bacterium]
MLTNDPIDFCPAAACAAEIVRIEGVIDHIARLIQEAEAAREPALLAQLEEVLDDQILAADEARDRLARAEAISAAGAMAQLLAAVRDIRIRDDAEARRAKDLEAKATRFLADARLFEPGFCKTLSGSKLGGRMHVPPAREAIHQMS